MGGQKLDLFGQESLRADDTRKGLGYFGILNIPGGKIATEYSVGIELDGKAVEIPTLVPTLSSDELFLMINDIIPNNKDIPKDIFRKAVDHARERISKGMSPFAIQEDALMNEWDK